MDVIDCADDCGPCGHTRRYTFGITQHRNWIKPVVVLFLNDVAVVIEREVLRRHLKIVTLSVRERCVFLVYDGIEGNKAARRGIISAGKDKTGPMALYFCKRAYAAKR